MGELLCKGLRAGNGREMVSWRDCEVDRDASAGEMKTR